MAEIKAFAEQVVGYMNKEGTGEAEFKFWKRLKNNGEYAYGIYAAQNGRMASPLVYLEPYYDAYQKGMPLGEIAGQIREALGDAGDLDMEAIHTLGRFETAAKKLVFRLINADMNQELLNLVPHIRILDLAAIFYVFMGRENGRSLVAMVTQKAADQWDATPEALWKLALANSAREMPSMMKDIGEILKEGAEEGMFPEGVGNRFDGESLIYILTNQERTWGAGCILYPGELKKAASRLGGDLIVLPSSVHETLIFVRTGQEDPELLNRLISEVNEREVDKEEWLSNQAYGYSMKEDRLMPLSEMPPMELTKTPQASPHVEAYYAG